MQRRESYRLETPITDSPICTIRQEAEQGEALNLQLRVIDISSGGLAVLLTDGMPLLEPQRTYRNCILQPPDTTPITLQLTVCSHYKQTLPNGSEGFRVGMHFSDLPRGADETIQRYIFSASTASATRARAACSEPARTARGRHLKLLPTPPMLLGHSSSVSAAAVLPQPET